ncbi:PQQ-binding-like beta-propeller repeat protein [Streptodolium elevatio]|uniref:PQQ-binding-like beta-propeller repeat protein n=1 Tax=Streptodolium elevatio TaxID=3157996 RepID=A0ABV3DIJ5_9ACTN
MAAVPGPSRRRVLLGILATGGASAVACGRGTARREPVSAGRSPVELRQGAVRWTFDSYGTAAVSPAFAHGRIYVGGAGISALDPATGDVVWEQPTADIADCTPVVVDRTVFVTGGDLMALDADTGTVRWRRQPAPEGGFHHATCANGAIYVGTGAGSVSACDPATGRELWRMAVDRHVTAPPRFAGGAVYVSCEGGLQSRVLLRLPAPRKSASAGHACGSGGARPAKGCPVGVVGLPKVVKLRRHGVSG